MSRRRLLRHRLEYAAARAGLALCRALGPDRASTFGGLLGRLAGPWLPAHRTARRNLEIALGPLERRRARAILRGMWDNLGRVTAEYPHLSRLARERVETVGIEHVARLRDDGRPGLLFGAHVGNWELPLVVAAQHGLPLVAVYRAMNNPLVDHLIRRLRAVTEADLIPKGTTGGRRLVRVLREGGHAALLVDQKENEGIPVPFFGRDAMTTPAIAVFALAFDCPLVPVRVERLRGCGFKVIVEPPLEIVRTGDREADVAVLMRRVNARLEAWARARPEQWFWVHRRWPAAAYGPKAMG